MISWDENLCLGEKAGKERKKIISGIKRHKLRTGVFVIVPAVNRTDILDILPAWSLGKDDYKGFDIHILGLAKTKDEAYSVVQSLIEDALENTQPADIREYFINKAENSQKKKQRPENNARNKKQNSDNNLQKKKQGIKGSEGNGGKS